MMTGTPLLPYSPHMDDSIVLALFGCFLLSAYVLARSSKFLWQLGKDFVLHRERISLFADSTGADIRCSLLLLWQFCFLVGVAFFYFSVSRQVGLLEVVPPLGLCGIYALLTLFYLLLKWVIYCFIGWIFFDESRTALWINSYSTLLYYYAFLLFPFVLMLIYGSADASFSLLLGCILLLFAKILMFYKWLKLFCVNLYGGFLLFLYFCALEIVPCFVVYRGLIELNESLIIKI